MPITIHKAGSRYMVSVSPPEGQHWRSSQPMTPRAIFRKLVTLGSHTTDISDAFYAADPFWTRNEEQGEENG